MKRRKANQLTPGSSRLKISKMIGLNDKQRTVVQKKLLYAVEHHDLRAAKLIMPRLASNPEVISFVLLEKIKRYGGLGKPL